MSRPAEFRLTTVAAGFLLVGMIFGVLSVATCAVIDSEHAAIQRDIAVLDVEVRTIKDRMANNGELKALTVRVDNIEGRLFAIFLAVGGAFFSSVAGTIFSFMTHRSVKNGHGKA